MRSWEPPNLDCETDDEAELRELSALFAQLSEYAGKRARAISLRRRGSIQRAQLLERELDALHKQLPPWARW